MVLSEETKYKLAHDLGFGEKVEGGKWDGVTTGEVGSMREAIRHGEQAMGKESAHKNAK